jgi:hypothetical protein
MRPEDFVTITPFAAPQAGQASPPDMGEPPPIGDWGGSSEWSAEPEPVRIWGIAEFLAQYQPINYTIDGLLPGGSIYGVTAKRSAGKTAFLTSTALAVPTGRVDILGLEVEMGRVAYIILENPTDFA